MTQLIINKIRLENFLSHRNTEIELVKGVNVFIGPNGAGKTSILEAIHFALTGRGWRTDGRNRRDLVNRNASTALVELEFTVGEDEYTLRRRIGGPGTLLQRNGKPVARDESGLDKRLAEILGFDPEKLRNLALIPQGGITRIFVEERPAERKKILDMILGLHEYEEAGQKLVKVNITSESRFIVSVTPTRIRKNIEAVQERVDQDYKKILEELKRLENTISEAEKKAEEMRQEIRDNKLREKSDNLERLEEEYNRLSSRLGELKGKLDGMREEIRRREFEKNKIAGELETIEYRIREYKEKTRILEYEKELEELRKKLDDQNTLRRQLDQLEKELEGLRELKKRIEELRRRYPRSSAEIDEEKKRLKKKIEEAEDRLRLLREKIASVKTHIENITRQLDKYKAIIDGAKRKLALIDKRLADIDENILASKAEEIKNKFSKTLEELEEETNNTTLEIKSLRETITDLEEKKELLEKTRSPRCPLCGSPLTEEHREKIVRELSEKINEAKAKIMKLEKKRRQLDEKKNELEKKLRVLDDPLFTRLRESLEEKNKLAREYEDLQRELHRTEKELEKILGEKKAAEEKLGGLEEEYRGVFERETLERAFDEKRYLELLDEDKKLREEIEQLDAEIRSLSRKLGEAFGLRVVDSRRLLDYAWKRLEEARRLKEELIGLEANKESLSKRLRELGEELEKMREEYGRIEKEYRRLGEDAEKLSAKVMEARNARERLIFLEKEINSLEAEIEANKKILKKKLEELEELEREVAEANKALRKALIIKWLRDNLFHKDGVPKHLRKRYIAHLESLMENLMGKFNLEYNSVRIDEDYSVWLWSTNYPNREVGIRNLSGGEKVVVSLVAMLALYQLVVGGKIGFLALDEPTEYLDEDRREELVNVLKEFQGGKIIPQLLVVTHDERVREAGDKIFKVFKENGYSKVKTIEPGGELL